VSTLSAILGRWATGLLAQAPGSFWMPEEGSTLAPEVDKIFYFIFWISLFFFVLIVGLMIIFVIRYRRRSDDEEPEQTPSHNMRLEMTWTLIPLVLVIVMFIVGFRAYLRISLTPRDAYEVLVTAQKWSWQFTYPNGYVDGELHVPADKPVRLVMRSEDVIHSFYVPDFRIKKDVVPGRYTKTWFTAPVPGEHAVLCAEYCGTGHSDMASRVIVQSPEDFDRWLEQASDFLDKLPPAEAGQRLTKSRGCVQCHSADGSVGVGPSFLGIFGEETTLREGGSVRVDEDYLRESILDPQAKVVAGFEPVMPTFQGRLSDREITVIIEYIKSLGE